MFCQKMDYLKIKNIHLRALKTIHLNFSLSYSDLLIRENTISTHKKHLKLLLKLLNL